MDIAAYRNVEWFLGSAIASVLGLEINFTSKQCRANKLGEAAEDRDERFIRLKKLRSETQYCGDPLLDFGIEISLFELLLFLLRLNHAHRVMSKSPLLRGLSRLHRKRCA